MSFKQLHHVGSSSFCVIIANISLVALALLMATDLKPGRNDMFSLMLKAPTKSI